jgi:hypothetical protein
MSGREQMSVSELNEVRDAIRSDTELIANRAADKAVEKYVANQEPRIAALEADVQQLKRDKWKAMVGWGIVAFIGALLGPMAAAKVKLWFGMQ